MRRLLSTIYHKIIPRKGVIKANNSSAVKEREHIVTNCGLHGSYLIFSQEYINRYGGLEEVTFAYWEEWLWEK